MQRGIVQHVSEIQLLKLMDRRWTGGERSVSVVVNRRTALARGGRKNIGRNEGDPASSRHPGLTHHDNAPQMAAHDHILGSDTGPIV